MPRSERPIRVLKFGGAALADADRIRNVAEIVRSTQPVARPVVVVSALYGMTDRLEATITRASRRDVTWREAWTAMRNEHRQLVQALARPQDQLKLTEQIDALFVDLGDLLHGTYLLRECSARTRDAVLAFGERSSAPLVAAAFQRLGIDAQPYDARRMIATDDAFGQAKVDFDESFSAVRSRLATCDPVPVVTGFIAGTQRGETTTLGRGGSDYTAALVAAALSATALELWKDVDGVLSADPRVVPEAETLDHLSYAELMEMSHFGAKVIHPPSVHPTRRHGIPLRIRNFLHPERPGTTVTSVAGGNDHLVRGISSIPDVALLRLEGDGMVGVPGVAMRLFGALARRSVNVILISQGSSEHSICFAVAHEALEDAKRTVFEEFDLERRVGLVDDLVIDHECSILAIVGEGMRERPGIAGRLFGVLGELGISVRAMAQGSSELNLSFVVHSNDHRQALRAAHAVFFAEDHPRIGSIAVLGQGRVGSALLDQLGELETLRVVALANRRRTEYHADGLELSDWRERVDEGERLSLEQLAEWLIHEVGGPRVVVDCTASDDAGSIYERLLRAGVGVVAANKHPFSGPHELWRALHRAAGESNTALRYEATVGAGLPVISTARSLLESGDRILRVEGVLSGTLNYLCEHLGAGTSFSTAVRDAHQRGFTEPNPWDDLSGEDVRRKLCILARLCGLELEPEEIAVRPPLSGDGWDRLSLDQIWQRLPECDAELDEMRNEAAEAGLRLRFLARLDTIAGHASASLVPVAPEHPCFELRGTDNTVAYFTERYRHSPLVIRGPGAGPEVTAGGVLADTVAAARSLQRRTRS